MDEARLPAATTAGVAGAGGQELAGMPEQEALARLFSVTVPPLDLTSDMLLAAALAPTAPLRRAYPGVPFLSLFGYTPLAMWFSRVKKIAYAGGRKSVGGEDARLYNELTVIALLRRPAVFSPGIYATSQLTILAGHGYGMPKQPTLMKLAIKNRRVKSLVLDGGRRTEVRARLLTGGRLLGRLAGALWPLRIVPAQFPSGRHVRALLLATPRVQLAHIRQGRLALDAPWLPRPVSLLPLGLYLPDQLMQLPPPDQPDGQ